MRGAKRGRSRRPSGVRKSKQAPRDLSEPLDALEWVVGPEDAGERLDRFLGVRLPWRSRAGIVELLGAGQVRRNGELARKKARKLLAGDRVVVAVPPPDEPVRHAELAEQLDAAILYEDAELLALNKPAGLVVHPVGRIRANTLIQAVHWLFRHRRAGAGPERGAQDPAGRPVIPRICHRLDKDTSGVLVLAKTSTARHALGLLFERLDRRTVEKDYLGVVAGCPRPPAGRIELALGPARDAPVDLMMDVRPDGVPARTDYELVESFSEAAPAASLIRFRLHTGRQHQIRVHARAIGHPLLCDPLYGAGATSWPEAPDGADPILKRQALHAARLALPHPTRAEPLELEAPLPGDLCRLVEELRRGQAQAP